MNSSSGPAWLSIFAPYVEREAPVELSLPITMPAGRMIHGVAGVVVRLPRWTGEPFVDDFDSKSASMIELAGEHLFAELAVLRLLERAGWSGRWVTTARTEVWKYLTEWKDVPRDQQRSRPIEDAEPRQLLARIAGFNKPRRYKGCWDIFAWRDSEFAFVQCKRAAGKEGATLNKLQEEWLRSTLYVGDPMTERSFCVVQWDYA